MVANWPRRAVNFIKHRDIQIFTFVNSEAANHSGCKREKKNIRGEGEGSILRRPVVITMLIIFFYTFLFSESEQMEPNGPSSPSIHL